MNTLPLDDLERLKKRLRPQDLHRLRPDGLLNPDLPDMCLCGGLESPYLVGQASPALAAVAHASVGATPPPQALHWDDGPPAGGPKQAGAPPELQRAFWAKVAPPIYDVRVIDYTDPSELSWD